MQIRKGGGGGMGGKEGSVGKVGKGKLLKVGRSRSRHQVGAGLLQWHHRFPRA